MKRLGILISGRGSNFEAIAKNCASGRLAASIAVVISNRADAQGLETAREMGLTTVLLPSKGLTREEHDRQVVAALIDANVDLIVLAGYMRILTAWFIEQFPQRIVTWARASISAEPRRESRPVASIALPKVSVAIALASSRSASLPSTTTRPSALRRRESAA